MAKCNFCGVEIPQGTGKIFVKIDGKKLNFCSNKCEKNLIKLKRKPAKTRWTEEHHTNKKSSKESTKKSAKK